jgi:hypothetical protein
LECSSKRFLTNPHSWIYNRMQEFHFRLQPSVRRSSWRMIMALPIPLNLIKVKWVSSIVGTIILSCGENPSLVSITAMKFLWTEYRPFFLSTDARTSLESYNAAFHM